MAASAHLKTQSQTQNPKTRRRKRRETTISASTDQPPISSHHLAHRHRKRLPATVVSSDSAWCCSTTTTTAAAPPKPSPPSNHQQEQKRRTSTNTATVPAPETKETREAEPLSVIFTVSSPSPSPFTIRVSSPLMGSSTSPVGAANGGGGGTFASYPPSYSKFNNALTAGLLNPMSPPPPMPLDKTRSNPTLFDMMANEPDYHPRNPIPVPIANPQDPIAGKQPPASEQDRQVLLQERAAEIFGSCSPGNQFNDPASSDVKLTLSSKDGLSLSVNLHRQILAVHSPYFESKLSGQSSRQQKPPLPHFMEITDCDDVGIYVETLRLMYCKDIRKKLMREDVSKVLAILKVSAAIEFDAGIITCLEYLEAAPWAEDEEEKIATLLSQLHLENAGAVEVLKRVSIELPILQQQQRQSSNEETLSRLLQVVLQGKDEKARREMKGLVSKMLRENSSSSSSSSSSHSDLSKETLYSACDGCLQLLCSNFYLVADGSGSGDVGQIARQADNLHWMLDILIDRQIADEFLKTWAGEAELSEAHSKVPAVHRYEVSRVTARLFVGIGKGQVLVSKEARCSLLRRWLGPFYEDFGWMRRFWKGLDRHVIEEGLSNTILTLPINLQQEILMGWFDRFLNSGEDCPNLQRAFEVWWRRAFWRRHGEEDHPRQIQVIAAACENQLL